MHVTFAYDGASQLVASCVGLAPSTQYTLYSDDPDSGPSSANSDESGTLVISQTDIGGLSAGDTFTSFLVEGDGGSSNGVAADVFKFGTESSGGAGLDITWDYDGDHTVTATFNDGVGATYQMDDFGGSSVIGVSPLSLDVSDQLSEDAITVWIFYNTGPTPAVSPDIGAHLFAPGTAGAGGQVRPTLDVTTYADVSELFRVLKVRDPSAAQTVAAQGDIDTATLEINAELDWADDHAEMTTAQRELVKGVCIDRAADLWRHRESAPGILGVVDESAPATPGRYSWARYAARLSVIKDQWAVA